MNKRKTPWAVTWDSVRRERFMAGREAIRLSRSTRKMFRAVARAKKALLRIERLRRRFLARLAQKLERARIRELRRKARKPSLRIRTKWGVDTKVLPYSSWWLNGTEYKRIVSTVYLGTNQAMVDYHPIERLNPPRNTTYAQKYRCNSLKASLHLTLPTGPITLKECEFAAIGLVDNPIVQTTSTPLAFDQAEADRALLKAQAKVYDAMLHMNEYVVEYAQVLRLLRDPYRTALSFHKVLERWTRKNAWVYLPERTAKNKLYSGNPFKTRTLSNGDRLTSKVPQGAVLMSMRTKEVVSPDAVSKEVLSAACNRWLQYRYGIAPLVSDITTVMGMLVDNVPPPILKSKSARSWISRSSVTTEYSKRIPPFTFNFKVIRKKGFSYSAKQWFTQDDDRVPCSYKMGLHPSQFIKALWNATPWSFVADWVVHIDDWLTGITDVPWIKLGPNVVTAKEFEVVTSICTSVNYYADTTKRFTMNRSVLAKASMERMHRRCDQPRVTKPTVNRAWRSFKNKATAFALLHQTFIKHR